MKPALKFTELNKTIHDRKTFDCGTEELNTFLQQYAVRHSLAGISKTMVLPEEDNRADICSCYTLSHTEIKRQSLPNSIAKKLPHYPIPVLLVAQLAVNRRAQGQGLGKITLIRALKHCYQINQHLPSCAVVVDALDEGVQAFYTQYGFRVLDTNSHRIRLFLSMATVGELFGREQ